jgi:hypothetical protein
MMAFMKMKSVLCFVALLLLAGCASPEISPRKATTIRANSLRGCRGTYNAPPRLPSGRADIPKLFAELEDIHANTYHWLIRNNSEWEDLKTFLPEARKKNINAWVTLLPPSESPPITKAFSEPFQLDFVRWAEALARLSLQEPNLVAWSIDDFLHNQKLFTPAYVAEMVNAGRRINPKLAFAPCCYFKQITPKFATNYMSSIDGILFPYRAESVGANLQDATQIEKEVASLRKLIGPEIPIVLDIYATAHSRLGASTPEYVEELMIRGNKCCDGVMIYCHQHPERNAEKYQIVKKQFGLW